MTKCNHKNSCEHDELCEHGIHIEWDICGTCIYESTDNEEYLIRENGRIR